MPAVKTPIVICEDISIGEECFPIRVVNEVDDEELDPNFVYCTKFVTRDVSILKLTREEIKGSSVQKYCDCEDGNCRDRNCPCKDSCEFDNFDINGNLLRNEGIIRECSHLCGCNPEACGNRVCQKPIEKNLEIFKTKQMGWGVRALKKIKKGNFVCEYTGELLTEKRGRNRQGEHWYLLSTCIDEADDLDCNKGTVRPHLYDIKPQLEVLNLKGKSSNDVLDGVKENLIHFNLSKNIYTDPNARNNILKVNPNTYSFAMEYDYNHQVPELPKPVEKQVWKLKEHFTKIENNFREALGGGNVNQRELNEAAELSFNSLPRKRKLDLEKLKERRIREFGALTERVKAETEKNTCKHAYQDLEKHSAFMKQVMKEHYTEMNSEAKDSGSEEDPRFPMTLRESKIAQLCSKLRFMSQKDQYKLRREVLKCRGKLLPAYRDVKEDENIENLLKTEKLSVNDMTDAAALRRSSFFYEQRRKIRPHKYEPTAVNRRRSDGDDKLKDYVLIDPMHIGNLGRFFNHSCDPNLAKMVCSRGEWVQFQYTDGHLKLPQFYRMVLFAKKDIPPYTELTWDYGANYEMTCKCGAETCKSKKKK